MNEMLLVAGGEVDCEQLKIELEKITTISQARLNVIGVDGGTAKLVEAGCIPKLIFGDFDSLDESVLRYLAEAGTEIRRFPEQKDETDLELALEWVAASGYQSAVVLGGLGGRFDHSLGNIGLLLKMWNCGLKVTLLDKTQKVFVFEGTHDFHEEPIGRAVSLIPVMGTAVVTTEGFEYPLYSEKLLFTSTRGIHNKILTAKAKVNSEGLLLAVCFGD